MYQTGLGWKQKAAQGLIQQQIQGNIEGRSQRSFQNSHNSFDLININNSENNLRRAQNQDQIFSINNQTKIKKKQNKAFTNIPTNNNTKRNVISQQVIIDNNEYTPLSQEQYTESTLHQLKQKSLNLTKLGKSNLLKKDYQLAIQNFTEAISLDLQNQEAKFYRGLSYLDSGLLKEAIIELNEVLQSRQEYQQLTYVLLSIAYKRSNAFPKATKILSDCIVNFPNYPDAFLARGQGFLLQEKFEKALQDFNKYTQLVPQHCMGYIGIGDSYKAMCKWNESIQAYNNAVNILEKASLGNNSQAKQHLVQSKMKRGIAAYNAKNYQLSNSDFQDVLSKDKTQQKAHFYIGKMLCKSEIKGKQGQQKCNDAILHFEQVVKYNQNEIYSGNALFEIAKLRLKDKDFYEAYFNLKRALDSNFTSKRMQLYKDFTEGVLYLIKRKIKKGVQILSDLLELLVNNKEQKDKKMIDYLKQQVYIYRSYGYVAIEKYEVAIEDINRAKKYGKVDSASLYNKLLGKGILKMDHEEFLMATKYFKKASLKFPGNKDPYCLYIISIVRSYSYSLKGIPIDQDEKKQKIIETKEFMDNAISNCYKTKEPSLYFFRGLLYFQLHMFYEALQDFNSAIEGEEEPTASYYLARGRCYACLSILTEAMKDLSIALNLDDTLQEAYIYRGKCAYLLGDNNLAFLDFQRLILTDPKNPIVHVYAGNLLMTTGAYQDAIKAFLNADTINQTAVAAFQRARCYCALTDLNNASKEIQQAINLSEKEVLSSFDQDCINQLIKVQQSFNDLKSQKKVLKNGIECLNKLIEAFQSGIVNTLTKSKSPLNIQIIPNVKRIKIEKVIVAKDLIQQQQNEKQEIPSMSIDMEQVVDLDQLKQIPLYSYYYENVFQIEDFHLFRAAFYFYMQEYELSINDFKACQELRNHGDKKGVESKQNESLIIFNQSKNSTPMLSMHSSKTDLSDVGLCSLNVNETNYNLLLCYIQLNSKDKALQKVNDLIQNAPNKYQKHFYLIRGLLYEELNQKDKSQKDFEKFQKSDSKAFDTFFKENKDLFFEPFPLKNRLCNLFGTIQLKIGQKRPSLNVKLSFSMPFIKPPNMIPNIDEEIIQEEFNLKQIDAPMPEAPWIKRWQNGIKFTDDMQEDEFDITDNEKSQKIEKESVSKSPKTQKQKDNPNYYQENLQQNKTLQQNKKHLSEQILQQEMVYFVDQEEELSDKHKVSLFDDSKFEDITIGNIIDQQANKQNNNKDSYDELLEDQDEEDQDSSDNESNDMKDNAMDIRDRESMVLMGENNQVHKDKNQIRVKDNHSKLLDMQSDMNIQENEQSQKMRIMSELQSQIDQNEENFDDRESLFKSRRSSIIES